MPDTQIPEIAASHGLKANGPFDLFPPNSPQERLLYAILLELQRNNDLLHAITQVTIPVGMVAGNASEELRKDNDTKTSSKRK